MHNYINCTYVYVYMIIFYILCSYTVENMHGLTKLLPCVYSACHQFTDLGIFNVAPYLTSTSRPPPTVSQIPLSTDGGCFGKMCIVP